MSENNEGQPLYLFYGAVHMTNHSTASSGLFERREKEALLKEIPYVPYSFKLNNLRVFQLANVLSGALR